MNYLKAAERLMVDLDDMGLIDDVVAAYKAWVNETLPCDWRDYSDDPQTARYLIEKACEALSNDPPRWKGYFERLKKLYEAQPKH